MQDCGSGSGPLEPILGGDLTISLVRGVGLVGKMSLHCIRTQESFPRSSY